MYGRFARRPKKIGRNNEVAARRGFTVHRIHQRCQKLKEKRQTLSKVTRPSLAYMNYSLETDSPSRNRAHDLPGTGKTL